MYVIISQVCNRMHRKHSYLDAPVEPHPRHRALKFLDIFDISEAWCQEDAHLITSTKRSIMSSTIASDIALSYSTVGPRCSFSSEVSMPSAKEANIVLLVCGSVEDKEESTEVLIIDSSNLRNVTNIVDSLSVSMLVNARVASIG